MILNGILQGPQRSSSILATMVSYIHRVNAVGFFQVEAEGMEILRKEERTLTKEEAAEFYKQHEGSEHFEDLVEFMSR